MCCISSQMAPGAAHARAGWPRAAMGMASATSCATHGATSHCKYKGQYTTKYTSTRKCHGCKLFAGARAVSRLVSTPRRHRRGQRHARVPVRGQAPREPAVGCLKGWRAIAARARRARPLFCDAKLRCFRTAWPCRQRCAAAAPRSPPRRYRPSLGDAPLLSSPGRLGWPREGSSGSLERPNCPAPHRARRQQLFR